MRLRHLQVLLFYEGQHGALGQLVQRPLTNQSLPAMVHSEEEIEDDADNRYEEDNQRPCHRLGGLPIVQNDVDKSQCNDDPRQDDTYYIYVVHALNHNVGTQLAGQCITQVLGFLKGRHQFLDAYHIRPRLFYLAI